MDIPGFKHEFVDKTRPKPAQYRDHYGKVKWRDNNNKVLKSEDNEICKRVDPTRFYFTLIIINHISL